MSSERKIVIKELEEVRYKKQIWWTDEEESIMKEYYGKVPIKKLSEYLQRSQLAIGKKAILLGLTHKR